LKFLIIFIANDAMVGGGLTEMPVGVLTLGDTARERKKSKNHSKNTNKNKTFITKKRSQVFSKERIKARIGGRPGRNLCSSREWRGDIHRLYHISQLPSLFKLSFAQTTFSNYQTI